MRARARRAVRRPSSAPARRAVGRAPRRGALSHEQDEEDPGAGSASSHGTSTAALGASSVGQGASPASGPARTPGTIPSTTQARASTATAARIGSGVSTASSIRGRRGRPSRTSPTTFTKQSTASAAVAASAPSASAPVRPAATPPFAGTASSDWSVSHSDANPFSGGSPAIAIAPTRKAPPVQGIRWRRPPRRSISSEPAALERARAEERGGP